MVEDLTKAFVREIGRNYGKAVSNHLLGDAHSTPYRRVGSNRATNTHLGAGSGGRNYDNLLDKLITTFVIKGKLATFNSAQNIYMAYFQLVKEAKTDGLIDAQETIYLIQQYYRAISKLDEISKALIELDANDKSQLVIEKIISMNEFIKSLDENLKYAKIEENKIDSFSKVFGWSSIIFSIIISLIIVLNFKYNYYNIFEKSGLLIAFLISVIGVTLGWILISSYNKKQTKEQNRLKKLRLFNELKDATSKAANSINISVKH
ncbi:hypothetical protein [Winogradskyella helgolandensis]|nr:hypothetical protein [Winogradskyella helgolandensis]